jgi:SAM-dependent methyltransferase
MSDDRDFSNAYDDAARAASYDQLEYPATYHLAFRDIPELVKRHAPAQGRRALDFGCGAGRSTRFLKQLGYEACGADISAAMLDLAAAATRRACTCRWPTATSVRTCPGRST